MIYKKDAIFPYPILAKTLDAYEDNSFSLDVVINEDDENYYFEFETEIGSQFIKDLLINDEATRILIIQTKDNKFFKLEENERSVKISKKKISINGRISVQMHIITKKEIHFDRNQDLIEFFDEYKSEIFVGKNSLLAFSDIEIFDGDLKKPMDLFEQQLDLNLKSEIEYRLGPETIIIRYKDPDFQFNGIPRGRDFNYPYIYTGLRIALYKFIVDNSAPDERYVDLAIIDEPENELQMKLLVLMRNKMITEISEDSIDEVITKISDKIIERYTKAVKMGASNEN